MEDLLRLPTCVNGGNKAASHGHLDNLCESQGEYNVIRLKLSVKQNELDFSIYILQHYLQCICDSLFKGTLVCFHWQNIYWCSRFTKERCTTTYILSFWISNGSQDIQNKDSSILTTKRVWLKKSSFDLFWTVQLLFCLVFFAFLLILHRILGGIESILIYVLNFKIQYNKSNNPI